ncbi:hypothetical protein B0H10DRAFT_2080558 [Mycena sp. CBHHK59/15]|nr:hypothetical protein B0H10DRAFT_2080558 [Mycena sp. CBHHK59/15]
MTTVQAFRNGVCPIVTTRGPGKIHLLSFESNVRRDRFMISHSYSFTQFAFYWDGAGEAVWTLGDWLARQPVGTGWATATSVPWNGQPVAAADVRAAAESAVQRDNQVTCFIIPELT